MQRHLIFYTSYPYSYHHPQSDRDPPLPPSFRVSSSIASFACLYIHYNRSYRFIYPVTQRNKRIDCTAYFRDILHTYLVE